MPFSLEILAIIAIALFFDFSNGFHDAANWIATVVSTRVLKPHWAVAWAAFFNFVAFLVFPLHVATTIGKGIVIPEAATIQVVAAGLIGAIVWDLITWYFGIPTSSSHALLGGFGGAAMAYAAKFTDVLHFDRFIRTVEFIVISPVLGLALSMLFIVALLWSLRRAIP